MNDDQFGMSVRMFLKKVGITSQREIETTVRAAIESGRLQGNEKLAASMHLTVNGVKLDCRIDGEIALE